MRLIQILSIFMAILLSLSFAQQKQQLLKVELRFNETSNGTTRINQLQSFNKIMADWVLVDTMNNSFGPASSLLNPIAYDHSSEALILVQRGSDTYTQTFGEVWYNLSTDFGFNWNRVSAINDSAEGPAGYPSAAISNPTGGGLSLTKGVFTWTHTNSRIFDGSGYGMDDPIGSGSPLAGYDSVFYVSSGVWTDGEWSFWPGENHDNYSITIARTNDFITIEHYQIPDSSAIAFSLGGVGLNGTQYLGFIGAFPDPNPGNPIYSGFYPGYSKSTNNGISWSSVEVIDFRTIPSLTRFDRLFDYIKGDSFFVSYTGDINIDKDGYVHLILSVTDTTIHNNTGVNALVEIYETASGWDGKIVYEGINDSAFTVREGPAIEQMGPSGYLAFDKNREQMACVWVTDSPTSPLGLCDVYISWRNIYSNDWSEPINLTQTNEMNENGAHLAPQLFYDLNLTYKAFVGYFYELGYFGPDPNILNKTGFWITGVTHTPSDIAEDGIQVKNYILFQNYPNPFNPTTKIKFTIPSSVILSGAKNLVILKVYDVLGNEITTLVNEEKTAGSYQVEFNNSTLPSGVYFYQLRSGNFGETKKMILMK